MSASPVADVLAHRPATSGRVVELDALRGLAAASVVWFHWRITFTQAPAPWFVVPFTAGLEAVILFFVLSGYVLAMPFWAGKTMAYPEFLVRRVSRIYLPYVGAVALAAVGCLVFYGSPLPLGTPYFREMWDVPLGGAMLLKHLRMDLHPSLNIAFWTLRYEMLMSLVFPGLCAGMRGLGRFSGIYLAVGLRLISSLLGSRMPHSDLPFALYLAIFFVVGAELARERAALARLRGRLGRPVLWGLLAVSLLAYYNHFLDHLSARPAGEVTALGVLLLIVLVQDARLRIGLTTVVAQYLGRVSYSLYLVHGVVLLVVLHLLYGVVPKLGLAVVYGAATLVVTHLFCVGVEERSMNLGKSVASWMRGRSLQQ